MGPIRYIVILFPVLTLLALLGFFCWYWRTQRSPLARRDAIPILLITCIYAVTAFAHLGSLQAPQSAWDFGDGESATFSLPESVQVSRLWYYPNLGTGKYQVEISADGTQWLTLWSRTETDETGRMNSPSKTPSISDTCASPARPIRACWSWERWPCSIWRGTG